MKHSSVALCLLTAILSVPLWTNGDVHATDWVVSNTADSDAGMPPIAGSLRVALDPRQKLRLGRLFVQDAQALLRGHGDAHPRHQLFERLCFGCAL